MSAAVFWFPFTGGAAAVAASSAGRFPLRPRTSAGALAHLGAALALVWLVSPLYRATALGVHPLQLLVLVAFGFSPLVYLLAACIWTAAALARRAPGFRPPRRG